ncbi:zinc finger protein 568 [Monomorium pharaonis]|uniref:zinc finger protein 568 n=1 Tax=Monomorium pharaonis TaxID=307658 RepID=UPI00063FA290|nr:zinc finger protein 568 [Monomorium pharaonis]XP_012529944.1 zinc finger protein 568 [Monomorium pharaonis]
MGQTGDQDSDNVTSNLQNEHKSDIQNEESKKKYKCDYPDCQAMFVRPSKLERHIRSHTGERPYKCKHPGCTKSYTNSSHLKRHMETHNPVKKLYECTICSMALSSPYNLKHHYKRAHTEVSCKECGITFAKKNQLNKHVAVGHSTKSTSYKCNKCNKSYLNLNRLKRHLEIHQRTYLCPASGCTEEFEKWSLLLEHRAKHNYTCDTCGKVFLGKYKLKLHRKIHSKDRLVLLCPYDNCDRTYLFKNNLDHHVRVNHLGKKFYCDICSKGLVSKKILRLHIQYHYKPKEKERKKQQKKRKDAGMPKKSIISALIGVDFPPQLEKMIMERETKINDTMTTTLIESS